ATAALGGTNRWRECQQPAVCDCLHARYMDFRRDTARYDASYRARRLPAKNPDGYCGVKGTGVSCPIGGGGGSRAELASSGPNIRTKFDQGHSAGPAYAIDSSRRYSSVSAA